MNELKRQSELAKRLNKMGAYTFKVRASENGVPDLCSIYRGSTYWFEVKTFTKLSQSQLNFLLTTDNSYVVINKKNEFKVFNLRSKPFENPELMEVEWISIF